MTMDNFFVNLHQGQSWAYRDINVRMMTRLIYQLYNKSFPELLKGVCLSLLIFQETGWKFSEMKI